MKFVTKKLTSLLNWIKKRWKLALVLTIILLLIGGWQLSKANSGDQELTYEPVRRGSLTKTLDISGIVDAKEKARVRFLAGGKLVFLGAQEGDWVKKWQTLASIDKQALQKQLQQDLNFYADQRWSFEDYQDEYDYAVESLATRKNLDKQQRALENQVLTVEMRDIAIKEASLYSPLEGVLVKSPSTVTGVQLTASDYFEVINPKTLIFRAEVDEADINLISLGQKSVIELDAYDGQSLETQLSYIAYSSTTGSSGTVFLVEFPLLSEDLNRYRLGMNGDAKIIIESKDDVLIVPFEATISRDGKYYVNIKNPAGQPEEKEVQLGLETEDEVEIVSGLAEGDLVLIPE